MPRLDPGPPLWRQPPVPWPFQAGAMACWLAVAAVALIGAAWWSSAWDPSGWSAWGIAGTAMLVAGGAGLLGMLGMLQRTPRQRFLAGIAVAAASAVLLRLA